MAGGDDRKDPELRKASLLLSALVLTPDDALDSYRDRRAADPKLDTESLKRAREVLDAVGFCIRGKDADNWRRLDQAWEIIRKITPPPPEEEAAPEPAKKAEAPKAETKVAPVKGEAKAAPEPVAPAEPKPVAPPPPVKPPPAEAPPVVQPPPVSQPSPVSQSGGASPWATAQASAPEAPSAPEVPDGYETAALDIAKVMGGAPLPFQDGAPARPPAASTPADEAPPSIDPFETEAIDMTKIDLDVMPFSQPRPAAGAATSAGAPAPELTLEQYASMCAELQSDPSQAAAVDTRYGATDEAASHALQTSWQAKLSADASERARFDGLLAQYVAALQSR
ncbi:MAG: hypothetical protein VB934_01415 [Polyangiaceae bacterium]